MFSSKYTSIKRDRLVILGHTLKTSAMTSHAEKCCHLTSKRLPAHIQQRTPVPDL